MAAVATQTKIPVKWRKLFKLIPGYDPMAQADGYYFDPDAAKRVIDFFAECIKHVKGPMAGKPFVLEPWQVAVTGCLFGWKHEDTGLRRYRECLIYVAKKNGKSAWVAGFILYMLACDGEQGAELYSAASSREQAAIIFSHAIGMVKQEPMLADRLKVYGGKGGSVQKAITYEDKMSTYKCLAADANTADGASPTFSAVDEIHRHKSPELADVLVKSTAARAEPMTVYTTTADYNRVSLCNTIRKRALAVRDNGGDRAKPGYDPAFLPVIYEASIEDDFRSEATWRKANPNLGVSVYMDFLKRECQKAVETPSELNSFLRLHLNIVTDADVAWLTMDTWDECGGEVDSETLAGAECFVGIDLSSTIDVSAVSLYFPESGAVVGEFFVPRDNIKKRSDRDRVPYDAWARDGLVTATSGSVIDYDVIRHRVNELGERYNIRTVAIDRWNATHLSTQLMGDGFHVEGFGQGYKSMSPAMKELEALILSGRLKHGGNPVFRWMAGNVMAEQDDSGNIKPSKKKSAEKIDGIVALIMAIGCSMVAEDDTFDVESAVFAV